MPQIKNLNVKCEKNHMKVNLEFDRPFYGAVFSKGHFNDAKCVHLTPGSGHVTANFDIFLGACGMTSSESTPNSPSSTSIGNGLYIENTIIIQYDAQVQEIWDQARRLRCTWYDYYEKAVTFKTFSVEMQDAVTANFLGDNIQCWMQIQTGKGPWASEVAGIVKIGQTMTMVLAIKDDENKFDMLVRNCIAHDGKHQPIQLVDDSGCVIRPKIMSKFHKVKNFGQSATVVSYAYFQAFKFPDSMNVHFQCVIQVCRHECPEPVCDGNNKDEGYIPPVTGAESRLVSVGHRIATSQSQQVPVYRPTPGVSVNYHNSGSKQFHHRSGDFEDFVEKFNDTFNTRHGSPRSLKSYKINNSNRNNSSKTIEKRSVLSTDESNDEKEDEQESTSVQTNEKIIQVVAPGDVAFSIASIDAESDSITSNGTLESIFANRIIEENNICMSSANLLIAIVIFSILLIVSSLIAAFLYYKLRQLTKMSYVCKDTSSSNTTITTYDSPEFYSSLNYTGLPRAHTKK